MDGWIWCVCILYSIYCIASIPSLLYPTVEREPKKKNQMLQQTKFSFFFKLLFGGVRQLHFSSCRIYGPYFNFFCWIRPSLVCSSTNDCDSHANEYTIDLMTSRNYYLNYYYHRWARVDWRRRKIRRRWRRRRSRRENKKKKKHN